MKTLKQIFVLAGAMTLLGLAGALIAPREARAVAAALVQVTNTAANPVPVTVIQRSTKLITSSSIPSLGVDNGDLRTIGPIDVSQYSMIRFFGDPAVRAPVIVSFRLIAVDESGNEFALDSLDANSTDHATVTGTYQVPGTSLKVLVFALCDTSRGVCPGVVPVNFTLYGQ